MDKVAKVPRERGSVNGTTDGSFEERQVPRCWDEYDERIQQETVAGDGEERKGWRRLQGKRKGVEEGDFPKEIEDFV
ncbi:hypothetical protein ACLOJK_012297 [Asimina triloba]